MAPRLRELLASPSPVVSGCWCTLPQLTLADSLASAGFDTVLIDLQHGHVTYETLAAMVRAVETHGTAPIVRTGWRDPESVIRALDLGAAGVIAPMIDTAAHAAEFASAMRYPPHGERSYSPNPWNTAGPAQADADVVCLPMIETAAALGNVEEIAAVDGVDGLFVGPSDLALSLGVPLGDKTHPKIVAAVDTVVAAARRHDRFVATIARDAAHARDLLARGVRLVTLGSDFGYVALGARQSMDEIRALAAETAR